MAGTRRRLILTGMGLTAAYFAFRQALPILADFRDGPFAFESLDTPKGYRRIEGGEFSGGFDPLIGLEETNPTPFELSSIALETQLFGTVRAGTVPIASFSDYNCPYCRVMSEQLIDLEKLDDVTVAWHELPLLGGNSFLAAIGALAAGKQGAYLEAHTRLMRTRLLISDRYLIKMASDLGLDADQYARDLNDPDLMTEIEASIALGRLFGLFGTPALVIGRTVVLGEMSARRLGRLIELERREAQARAK